ncbi:uncharacterized protein LOC115327425 [Ixodes scapularis]|uniref:uncharacterized protein LOC115327425 n=1 Tax=Ixodes scapularis TaxID=6945 RepID=UPI001A9E3650|nr:uncharacterized protein LOC115327425 [Ixodes scapularis]
MWASQRGEVARQGDAHAGASWGTRAAAPAPSESSGGTPRSTWRPRGRAGQFESFESAHARPEPRDASPSANGDQAPVRQPQGTDGETSWQWQPFTTSAATAKASSFEANICQLKRHDVEAAKSMNLHIDTAQLFEVQDAEDGLTAVMVAWLSGIAHIKKTNNTSCHLERLCPILT